MLLEETAGTSSNDETSSRTPQEKPLDEALALPRKAVRRQTAQFEQEQWACMSTPVTAWGDGGRATCRYGRGGPTDMALHTPGALRQRTLLGVLSAKGCVKSVKFQLHIDFKCTRAQLKPIAFPTHTPHCLIEVVLDAVRSWGEFSW